MPNWKKVIVSGSNANLTDVTIDDWGSVSASLAAIESGSTSTTLQEVTDNGNTTTNPIIVDSFISISTGGGPSTSRNIAIGSGSLENSTISIGQNTAIGNYTLQSSITGFSNTAVGYESLTLNTLGSYNVGVGYQSLIFNSIGSYNTAIGNNTLSLNTSGSFNTALGHTALYRNQTGDYNVGLGYDAGRYTSTGGNNTSPNNAIYLGSNVRSLNSNSTNEIVIGSYATGSGTNTVTIGNSDITDNYFSGNISGSDVVIDDWGSVSASLASLDASSSPTLQDVTDNGNLTTNSMILSSSTSQFIISASGDTTYTSSDSDTSGIITTRNISNSGQSNRDGQDSFKRAVDGYTYNTYHTEGGFGAGLPTQNGDTNVILTVQHTKYVGATLDYTIYNMASGSSDITGARTGTAHYVFKSGSGTFSLTDTSTTDIGEDLGGGLTSFTDHYVFTGSITPGTSYFDIQILRNPSNTGNFANIVGTFKFNRRTRYTPGDDVALEIGGPETEIYTQG